MILFPWKQIFLREERVIMSEVKPPALLPDLEAHLGYWLRFVSNQVSSEFARALYARQFSVAEWVALRRLYGHSDLTATELAEQLGMTRGAISKILVKLESKGIMVRRTKPEDSRSHSLVLTPEGQRVLPELVAIAEQNEARFFDCLEPDERAQLESLLKKLVQIHQWKEAPVD